MSTKPNSSGSDSVTGGTTPLPFVSVIIPVYNDRAGLRKCLPALRKQTYPQEYFEIVLIDNDSEEDLSDIVKEFQPIRFLRETKVGSYAARNKGIRESDASILAFTDSDCEASPQWLEVGVKTLQQPECKGVVGGKVDFGFENPESPSTIELYDAVTFFNQEKYIRERGFSGAGNLFVRRDVFDQVGLFEEMLKSGGDREWGERCHGFGIQATYAPQASVTHPTRRTFDAVVKKTRRVAGGVQTLRKRTPSSSHARPVSTFERLLAPVKKTFHLWRDPRLPRIRDRMRVIAMTWILTFVSFIEIIRVRISGVSRRS